MVDVFTKAKRSEIMSKVRSARNKATEVKFVSILRSSRITGWRRNSRLFGKPDFVFPSERIAVFVDGCFWHCCPKHGSVPVSNELFWNKKLARNRQRDLLVGRTLRFEGWRVLRIWQHELRNSDQVARRVKKWLHVARMKQGIQEPS